MNRPQSIKPGLYQRVRIKAVPGDPLSDRIAAVHGQAGVVVALSAQLARVELDSGDAVLVMFDEVEPA